MKLLRGNLEVPPPRRKQLFDKNHYTYINSSLSVDPGP